MRSLHTAVISTVCFMLVVGFSATNAVAQDAYYVAFDGSDQNPGTVESPFATLEQARNAIRESKSAEGLPDGGITVWVKGGMYPFTKTLVLTPEDAGTRNAPIVYRAMPDEQVVFDGGLSLATDHFQPVKDEASLQRLCASARGQVYRTKVANPNLAKMLSGGAMLALDGRMMSLSRFPNVGFAHINKILDKGAVYAQGRTQGAKPTYSMEEPVGGTFTMLEEPSGDWEAEFKHVQKARVSGYLSYDWYRESHRIARIEDEQIQLLEFSRYGVLGREKIPRRLVVWNLLCEVDRPGEWYFDEEEQALYLWPFEALDASSSLTLWAGPAFAELKDCSYVSLRDFTLQGVSHGDGMVVIRGGGQNQIAGCTLRNSTRMAVNIQGGTNNGIIGCDIYDVGTHLNLTGGDTETLTGAGNYAVNNHFTQVQATDFYGRIAVRGVGNIFRNNLVHNAIGQIMTVGGNDHQIELNEMFNIGIEEGDGGTIYSGASMWTFGNVYRHNFLHHLMCLPQAHPRGGIYPDDHDAGDTIEENIFYKAAHRAILINNGAGHTVQRNVFVNGYIGVYNTDAYAQKAFENIAKFESGELKRGDKGDHIWRTEQVIGKEGWNKAPWRIRYPTFQKVMNQERMRFSPIECRFIDNLFCGNTHNFLFRSGGWGPDNIKPVEEVEFIEVRGNRDIEEKVFTNLNELDLSFNDPDLRPLIPFEQIGIYQDEFRKAVPDKSAYRSAIKKHFENRPSYDPEAVYDPKTVNASIYFNTGKLILGTEH